MAEMKIETKFKIGDVVYYFHDGEVIQSEVRRLLISVTPIDRNIKVAGTKTKTEYQVDDSVTIFDGGELFKSKREIAESFTGEKYKLA